LRGPAATVAVAICAGAVAVGGFAAGWRRLAASVAVAICAGAVAVGSFAAGWGLSPRGQSPGGGIAGGIRVPAGYRVSIVARGLTHPTALAWGLHGRLLATEDVGRLVEIRHGRPHLLAAGLRTPLGLAAWGGSVFVSETARVERLHIEAGRVVARSVVVSGLPAKLHQQDNIVVGPDRRLYLGSGSTCDACSERDPRSATVLSLRLDGSDLRVVARGLRNPYGLVFQPGTRRLYASVNGRDTLGTHEPAEMVVRIRQGARYGWPACWPSWRRRRLAGSCRGVTPPVAYLEPHSSADGLAFWRGALYVAEWGQYDSDRAGRRVVAIHLGAGGIARQVQTFADGFDHPLPLLAAGRGLLVGDWGRGVVYRIARR
jgi:glucose/arabinose dehydrogenase